MINNFGQTPTRLFSEKHPCRVAPDPSLRSYKAYGSPFTGRRAVINLLGHVQIPHEVDVKGLRKDDLAANYVEVLLSISALKS